MDQHPIIDTDPSSGSGGRCDRGETLVSVVIAMVVVGMMLPAVLHMIYITAQVAATQPTPDRSVAAAAQLQSIFAELDPVRVCATPAGTGRRDQCQTTLAAVGASLVAPPADALEIDPMTVCWLARPDNPDTTAAESDLKVQCLMLRNDNNDAPFNPTARRRVGSDGLASLTDPSGGDELVVRTYDTAVPPRGTGTDPGDYLLPVAAAQSWPDRVIYFDAEWWCMRWRHPKDDTTDATIVGRWLGACPCPADTFEQVPLSATIATITDPDPLTPEWVPPPHWADTDGRLTPGDPLDDGNPYDTIPQLAGQPGSCDREPAALPDGTANPAHCDTDAAPGALPGPPILTDQPGAAGGFDACDNDAWWNPRYPSESLPAPGLRSYLLPPAAIPAGDAPPVIRSRVASIEIRVCVATRAEQRRDGEPHCSLSTAGLMVLGFTPMSRAASHIVIAEALRSTLTRSVLTNPTVTPAQMPFRTPARPLRELHPRNLWDARPGA